MSPAPSAPAPVSGRVIAFPARAPESTAASLVGVRAELAQWSVAQLEAILPAFFQQLDDTLFDWANRSHQSQAMMDGLRAWRHHQDRVAHQWPRLHRAAWAPAPLPAAAPKGPAPLALVSTDELEEDLAIHMLGQGERGATKHAHAALVHRLALADGRPTDGPALDEPPVGAQALAEQLRTLMLPIDGLTAELRIITYKVFGRIVEPALGPWYEGLNQRLAAAGFTGPALPVWQRPGGRSDPHPPTSASPKGTETPPASQRSHAGASESAGQAGAAGSTQAPLAEPSSDWAPAWHWFQQWWGQHQHAASPALWRREDVANALWRGALLERPDGGAAPLWSSQAIKRGVMEALEGLPSALQRTDFSALGREGDLIDLVGRLFEHLLEDATLTPPLRALVGRLQIPYLRAALLDPQWLAQPDHPAHQWLALMGQAGREGDATAEGYQAWLDQVDDAVTAISHDTRPLADALHEPLARLREQWAAVVRRQELRAQRLQEREAGQERLLAARRGVAQELVAALGGLTLPDGLRALWMRAWAHQWILVRLNAKPAEHAECVRVLKGLAQNMANAEHPSAAHRQRWAVEGEALLAAWGQGLARAGLDASHVTYAVRRYRQWLEAGFQGVARPELPWWPHPSAAGERALPSAASSSSPVRSEAALPEGISGAIIEAPALPESSSAHPAPAIESDAPGEALLEARAQVQALALNDWLELGELGVGVRVKVIWISRITRKIILSGTNGLKVEEVLPEALAERWAQGLVHRLPPPALMSRAMRAVAAESGSA